jgi:ketosteroid isomerase-like protein
VSAPGADARAAHKGLVLEYFAALRRGDLQRLAGLMCDDLRFWVAGGAQGAVVFHSPAELIRDIERSLSVLYDARTGLDPEIHSLTAEDDRVVAEVTLRGRCARSGEPYVNSYVFLFWVRDGRFAEIHEHLDTDYVRQKLLRPAGIDSASAMPWLDED